MLLVSGALVFGGYTLLVYGWSQLRGSNAGFFQILWPGRYTNVAASDGPSSSPPSSTGATPGGGLAPGGNPGSGLGSPGSSAKGTGAAL